MKSSVCLPLLTEGVKGPVNNILLAAMQQVRLLIDQETLKSNTHSHSLSYKAQAAVPECGVINCHLNDLSASHCAGCFTQREIMLYGPEPEPQPVLYKSEELSRTRYE